MNGKQRTGLAAAAVAALGVSFVTGLAVGGNGPEDNGGFPAGDPDPQQPGTEPIALVNADLTSAGSCEGLLDWYVDRGAERVSAYGWDSGVYYLEGDMARAGSDERQFSESGSPAVPQADGAENSGTGTNVQEAGVDEPDVVKTDGQMLVRAHNDRLTTYDVSGDEPELLDSIDLPDIADAEILLAGDTVVAIGLDVRVDDPEPDGYPRPYSTGWQNGATRMLVVDAADPAAMEITDTYRYDASLVTARQHSGVIRLALSSGLPDLDFVQPGGLRTEGSALERNREIVRESTLSDWLPGVTTGATTDVSTGSTTGSDDGDEVRDDLLDCADVAIPDDDAGLGTLTVVGFDAATPEAWDATAVATDSQIAYVSATRLVLATSAWTGSWGCCAEPSSEAIETGTTRLYSFALSGNSTTYVASGEVEGAVADRWAMDEADGVLRLAVGPTSMTGDFNSVVTLQETGDDLTEVGRVDKLGVGEQIKSVRWFDDLAIVVTFRQVDPLYAVDLTDPTAPELLGELKIPGFSEYLHPLGRWGMIGVGQDASSSGTTLGAQSALFDVHDVTDPRRLDVVTYRTGSQANAGQDPRQFTWLPDQRTALTVISHGSTGRTGWVSVLKVDGGRLTNRMVEVEYGEEVAQVRLVPLPTGQVVLVTGDSVSFFEL